MSGPAADDNSRCPRCGGPFFCGMQDRSAPCPCTTVELTAAQRTALAQAHSGCLCLACLRAVAAGAPLALSPPQAAAARAQA